MPVVIALLRGVNLAGHNPIKMEVLRALCESIDLQTPQTYVQSGNVVFKTKEKNLVKLAQRIAGAIERKFGFRIEVILRTPSDLRNVIAKNPFKKRRDIEPGKLLVSFLATDPSPEARLRLLEVKTDPEELHAGNRELYLYFPNGMGHSKLSLASIDRILSTRSTARNWNTVTKLLEMAEKLEAQEQ
jgi:uncharacterized protein (DUF1697 family)